MSIREEYIRPAMKAMVQQKEDSIRQVLDDLVPRWTLFDIARRCTFVTSRGFEQVYEPSNAAIRDPGREHGEQ